MNLVIRHIEYLAITHNCVILPAIGAILAHDVAARPHESGGYMLPPQRVFTFNPSLDHNDGMLAASIARAEGINYVQASQMIDARMQEMRSRLRDESYLDLGRIGSLVRNVDGSMRFDASSSTDLSPSCMWLPRLDLSLYAAREEIETATAEYERTLRRPRRVARYIRRVAATLAVLIVVAFTFTHPRAIDNPQKASLGIEMPETATSEPVLPLAAEATAPVRLVIEPHADAATPVDTAAYNAMRYAARHRAESVKRYCLVIASMSTEEEARTFIARHGDTELGILIKDGRFRVYAAEGATIAELNQLASSPQFGSRFPSSWICRK